MNEKKANFVAFWMFLMTLSLLVVCAYMKPMLLYWLTAPAACVGVIDMYFRFRDWLKK